MDANSDSISDLFWALEGKGPIFDIGTRFDLYTVGTRKGSLESAQHLSPELSLCPLNAFIQW